MISALAIVPLYCRGAFLLVNASNAMPVGIRCTAFSHSPAGVRRAFPFRFGRQCPARPSGISLRGLIRPIDRWMLAEAIEIAVRHVSVAPACLCDNLPPGKVARPASETCPVAVTKRPDAALVTGAFSIQKLSTRHGRTGPLRET
ncbi:hypothetical protein J2Y54_002355 [Sphingomonas sp. BE123]|nr:hypothetical protein [Sphingomonas sp. BE123]MDR6852835.1 hypothetical protein [Sphingomonas sp. BE123]